MEDMPPAYNPVSSELTNTTTTSKKTPWRYPRWQMAQGITLACGIAGVLILTVQGWPATAVKAVSMVFLPLFVVLALLLLILHWSGFSSEVLVRTGICEGESRGIRFAYHLWYLTIVIFAYFSDWLLAVVADDLAGLRYGSTDTGLYWAFFVARLLPFFVF